MSPSLETGAPDDLGSLRLADDVQLQLKVLLSGQASKADLAQGLIHDPAVLEAAEGLNERLFYVLRQVAHDCALKDVPFPQQALTRELTRLAHAFVASSASRTLTWGTSARGLPLLVPALQSKGKARQVRLTLNRRSRGQYLELSSQQLPEAASILAALAGGDLNRRRTELGFVGRQVVRAVHELGALVPHESNQPLEPAPSGTALRITHLAHAGALVEAGRVRVAIDPWLAGHAEHYEAQPFTARELGPLDVVAITHHHGDHMVEQALLTLPRNVLVLVPRTEDSALSPDYLASFAQLGFRNVRVVEPGNRVELDDGAEIDVLPFWGESRDRLGFGGNLYAVSRRGRSVFFHADAGPDGAGRSPLGDPAFANYLGQRERVDVVFGTWWQERQFGLALSPLTPVDGSLDVEDWLASCENCDIPFDYTIELLRKAKARVFFTYAEQGMALCGPQDPAATYIPARSFFWRSLEELRRLVRAQTTAELRVALPRTVVSVLESGKVEVDDSRAAPSQRAACSP